MRNAAGDRPLPEHSGEEWYLGRALQEAAHDVFIQRDSYHPPQLQPWPFSSWVLHMCDCALKNVFDTPPLFEFSLNLLLYFRMSSLGCILLRGRQEKLQKTSRAADSDISRSHMQPLWEISGKRAGLQVRSESSFRVRAKPLNLCLGWSWSPGWREQRGSINHSNGPPPPWGAGHVLLSIFNLSESVWHHLRAHL